MARKSSEVQALYEPCQNMFTPLGSPSPSSAAINKLSSALGTNATCDIDFHGPWYVEAVWLSFSMAPDTMSPADVGLKEENLDVDRGHGFFGLDQQNRVAPITTWIYMNVIVLR
ncbi:PREDICTED: plant cysteine oxidase 3 [Prunus dulcis]|uniref:PREDICTED: plant cysteine oxidase 3 n=1 Tax=Prunus dulcis TaxID=3755 RepID=A0A5E4EJS0_PRUDU|nr:hypothetical protein L3X38_045296 [Prunus dulcis]VVA14128.1 PREDICTED: plant cysteine oxidase 3 [Prunus dulcis]